MENYSVLIQAMLDIQKSQANINTQIKQIQQIVSAGNTKIKIDAEINPIKTATLETNIKTAQAKVQSMLSKYSAIQLDPKFMKQWDDLFDLAQLAQTPDDLKQVNAQIRLLEQNLGNAGKRSRSFGDEMGNNIKKMGTWMLLGAILAGVIRQITEIYKNVVKVNTAMTELRKVTDETESSYSRFLDNTSKKAKELSTGIAELVEATANFARLGYSTEDAAQLGQIAIMYKNVGDGVGSVDEATGNIISVLKAFRMETSDSIKIIDIFNEVGNNYAVTSGDIGKAMQVTGAALATGNNTLEQSVAMWTAMNEVLQNGDVSATSLKFIAARLRNTAGALQEMDVDADGAAETITKLRSQILDLTNVDIMTSEDEFKSTYDILKELASVWDDLTGKQQADVTRLVAGARQQTAFTAIMTNWTTAEQVVQTATNSMGSATTEYEKWQQSIEAHLKTLGAAWEEFSIKALQSDTIIGIVDLLNGVVDLLSFVADHVDLVTATILILSGVLGSTTKIGVNGFAALLELILGKMGLATGAAKTLSAALSVAIPVALIMGGIALIDALTITLDEHKERLTELQGEYQSVIDEIKTLSEDKITSPLDTPLTTNEKNRLDYLEQYSAWLQAGAAEERRKILELELFGTFKEGFSLDTLEGTRLQFGPWKNDDESRVNKVLKFAKQGKGNEKQEYIKNVYSDILEKTNDILKEKAQFEDALLNEDVIASPELYDKVEKGLARINEKSEQYQGYLNSIIGTGLVSYQQDVANAVEDTNEAVSTEITKSQQLMERVASLATAHEALSTALKQQADDGYLSKESYDALIATNSEYANSIDIVNGRMQINIDKAYEVSRAAVEVEVQELRGKQALAELNLEYELAHENSTDRVEDLRDEIQQYDLLIEKLIDSRSEMQEFKDASITNNSGANYDYSVDNMVKTFADGAETLRTQTDEFQSAARYFTGQESTTAEQASQWLEKNGSWVDGTADGFNNFIKASLEVGAVVQKNGQYMAADGMTAQKWAELVGTSAEFVRNELGKLNEYQDQNWQLQLEPPTREEIYKATGAQDYLNAYDAIIDAQQKMQSGDEAEAGRGTQQLLEAISNIDPDRLKETIDQMSILNSSSSGSYDEQLESLQSLFDLITNADTTTLGESIEATVTDATGKEYSVNLNADSAISSIQSQILAICSQPYSINISAKISGLLGGLFGGGGASGTANASGTSAANGRYKTRSGRTLMGELGQEMVVDMNTGSWYTVGDYGAEFRNLPENAIVFNHVQTQGILKNGRINNRGQAMAGGNAAVMWNVSGGGNFLPGGSTKKKTTGSYSSKTSSDSHSHENDSLTSETFENEIDMLEHQINILKDMINLYEEGSSQWFSQQSNIIDTYKAAAQVAQAEYDRLHSAGYNVASKEMRSLMEDVIKYKSEVFKASEAYWNAEKENATDTLKYYKSKTQAVVDLKKSYHDLVTEVQSEQISLDKEMQTAAQSYPFLSEGERAAVFDDADYKALSSELAGIVSSANAMYVQYLEQIKSVGEDSEYQLESITDEFERQYDLQLDAYNVAKARLAVFKAQKNLENVQGERSIAALIGGVWTWVADSDNVQSALEDLASAEQDLADAQNDATFNADIASLESTISAIDEQISAIDNLTFTMDGLATEIHSLVDEIQAQVLNNVSGATLSYLANPQVYSSTLTDLFSTSAAQNMWSSVASGAMTGLMNSINTSGFVAQILSNLSGMGSTTQTSGDHYQLVWEGNVVAEGEQVKTFIAMLRALVPLYDVNL